MIVDLTTVKTFLQITDSSKDSLINLILPAVQQEIFELTKNYFKSNISYTSTTVSFVNSNSVYTIVDSLSKFAENNILAGTYLIENSKYNDFVFTVNTATSSTLTVSEITLNESEENNITLTRLEIPKDLQILACKMVGFTLANTYNVKSETLSKYSVEYFADNKTLGSYPYNLMSTLTKYRRFYFD